MVRVGAACLAFLASSGIAGADASPTIERSATLATLFPAAEIGALSKTLPAEREIRFRWREPAGAAARGVLVFVSATDSGELPAQWRAVLDEKQLLWIAAEDFGNSRPTAERMLAAVMALKLARRSPSVDPQRLYVSGMSGGGRVASLCISRFPALFSGAVFMAGANALPPDQSLRTQLAARRFVFVTGSRDFNRREMKSVYESYRTAGLVNALLIDTRGMSHELATPAQLAVAIDFLDGR